MTELGEAAKKVQRLRENIETSVDREMGAAAELVEQSARVNVDAGTPPQVVSGRLQRSLDTVDARKGGSLTTNVQPDTYAAHAVTTGVPYAAYVEYGTGVQQTGAPESGRTFPSPSTPPVPQIKSWVENKPVIPDNPRYYGADGTVDTEALALDIAQQIAQQGTESHPFLRPAVAEHRMHITLAHLRGLKRAIRRTF